MTIETTILTNFPEAAACIKGHIGTPVVTYSYEEDDDRERLIRYNTCSHCHIPISGDEYVTSEEQDKLYAKGII